MHGRQHAELGEQGRTFGTSWGNVWPPGMGCHVRKFSREKGVPGIGKHSETAGAMLSGAVGREMARRRVDHPRSLGPSNTVSHRQLADAGGEQSG